MHSRQTSIWATALITYVIALIALILRFVAKRLINAKLNREDLFSVVAFTFTTGNVLVDLFMMKYGLGLQTEDGQPSQRNAAPHYLRLLWIGQWFYTFAIGFSKLTMLSLYMRLFARSDIKVYIQVLICMVSGWILARTIVIPIQCIPVQKFWDDQVPGFCPVETNYFFFGSTIPHLLMELAIVALPWWQVKQMHLRREQKVAVGSMFTFGLIVCLASLAQLVTAIKLDFDSENIAWTAVPELIWSFVEVNLAHFSTSMPALRPILNVALGKSANGTSKVRRTASKSDGADAEHYSAQYPVPLDSRSPRDEYNPL